VRELLSVKNINLLSGVIGAIASVFLSIAVFALVNQNQDQADQLACRSELAAQTDVLRSEVTIALSQGLIAITEDDDAQVGIVVDHLRDLQVQLAEASDARAQTVEICGP
jgi:hypothetical protein